MSSAKLSLPTLSQIVQSGLLSRSHLIELLETDTPSGDPNDNPVVKILTAGNGADGSCEILEHFGEYLTLLQDIAIKLQTFEDTTAMVRRLSKESSDLRSLASVTL